MRPVAGDPPSKQRLRLRLRPRRMGPSPKKFQVDPESYDHAFEELEVKNDHGFKDQNNSSTTIRKVEGRSNSSMTTTFSKSSKTKASSMTTKSKAGRTVHRRPRLWRVRRGKWVQWWPRLWRVWTRKRVRSGQEIGTDLHLLHVRGRRLIASGNLFDWYSTTYKRSQADRVQKLRLIFIYYKSKVAGRSGQEIGTDLHLLQVRGLRPFRSGNWTDLHLLQVRGLRPIGSGNWDWSSPTTSPGSQAIQARKLGLIFIYYKSEVSGWSLN